MGLMGHREWNFFINDWNASAWELHKFVSTFSIIKVSTERLKCSGKYWKAYYVRIVNKKQKAGPNDVK